MIHVAITGDDVERVSGTDEVACRGVGCSRCIRGSQPLLFRGMALNEASCDSQEQ